MLIQGPRDYEILPHYGVRERDMQPDRYGYVQKTELKYNMDGISGNHVECARGSCCTHHICIGHVVPVMSSLDQRFHIK